MSEEPQTISSLLLPMREFYLILPQANIVEIIQQPAIVETKEMTAWFKGEFEWRSETVALVSFTGLCGWRTDNQQETRPKVAILHTLGDVLKLRFYAFEMWGIPRSVSLGANSLTIAKEVAHTSDCVANHVLFGGQRAMVPDLERIEHRIQEQLGGCSRIGA
ncbi:MAG: hypothetical protein GY807_17565 [Gammaproteobacteria bacterium]|nr:hypothetical protein [Gammaproteobacteria bacterium]